ncbi:MAG: sigma 54-interacting transcriptional regulator [Desulfomonile tiedjei]|uniref:Sigma 54-interacting transcriptional regulator n=1 Tax=Desulfomonile tiedjei TaxID=2358 RepID=A0A9D6V034_9BACT|nr:sigma 54-interacting transcriptional regulator [Desulfomonile tiedjei]
MWDRIVKDSYHSERTGRDTRRSKNEASRGFPYLWRWDSTAGQVTIIPPLLQDLGYFECDTGIRFDGWDRWVHPDDLDSVTRAFDTRMSGRSDLYRATHRLRMASGTWYPVTAHEIQSRTGVAGKPSWIMGVFEPQDGKTPVEWLQGQKDMMFDGQDNTNQGFGFLNDLRCLLDLVQSTNLYHVFIMDTHLRYSWMNDLMQFQLDCPLSRSLGRTDPDVFGERSDRRLQEACRNVLNGRAARTVFTWPTGNELNAFEGLFLALRDRSGNPLCVYGISTMFANITDMSVLDLDENASAKSRSMRETLAIAETAAGSDSPILLLGETGSGKDWLAKHIHKHSSRATGPFKTVNCANFPSELFETELFGYEPGGHSRATNLKLGLIEVATGGTLVLDEIGDLPITHQAKFLTFLDSRKFTRIGGTEEIDTDVRIIAATNKDLKDEISQGSFRSDLYYRLSVFVIKMPPLRERLNDLPGLVAIILSSLAEEQRLSEPPHVDTSVLEILSEYSWPGNVRELRNVLERALILSKGNPITPDLIVLDPQDEIAHDHIGVQVPNGVRKESTTSDHGDELRNARSRFHGLSREHMLHHVKAIFVDVCGRESGSVTYIASILGTSDEKVRQLLNETRAGEAKRGRPRKSAPEEIISKIQAYLVDRI